MQQDAFEILKTAIAQKVGRGGGTIEYQIGRPRSGGDVHIRVTRNVDRGGYFGRGWVRAGNLEEAMRDAVKEGDGCFSSKGLANGTASRCRNDPPFLAAVLLAEGLTARCEQMPHKFRPSGTSFREWEVAVIDSYAESNDQASKPEQPPATSQEPQADGSDGAVPKPTSETTKVESKPPPVDPVIENGGPALTDTHPEQPKKPRRRGRRKAAAIPGAKP